MLNRDEHDTLRQIERNLASADPQFAALLRTGQRRLPRSRRRRELVQRALLVLLAYGLLVLGLASSALAVTALAAAIWMLRRWPIHQQM